MSELNRTELEKRIDILEDDISEIDPGLLNLLLKDKTTKGNIMWCTKDYEKYGPEYEEHMPMKIELITNIFASQASLPDDTILEYIENGYDIQQIARAMCSDINLIALKVDTLIAQGYQLRKQEHQNDFLKYSKKI